MNSYSQTRMPENSADDVRLLKKLLPYLMHYKGRTLLALSALLLAKFANVGIPLVFKEIVDTLDVENDARILLPLSLLVAYGLMRAGSALFNELRDALFAKVRYSIMHQISLDILRHLHQLSLRFHLDRQTGALTRDMERGTNSVNSLMNLLLFNVIPTLVEISLIAAVLWLNYDILFVLVTLATVFCYGLFTMKITQWRMKFRIRMNHKDSEASNHALDSMINFETVKYFNNEAYELKHYHQHLNAWKTAGIHSQTSMSALNFGQAVIIAIGVTAMMILAAQGVVDKNMTLGDLVLVNTFLLQLFIPLGFLGIVYSQIKHALSDIRIMFALFDEKPEIIDIPNAPALDTTDSSIRFHHVDFSYRKDRTILTDINLEIPQGAKVAVVGHSGSGKSTLARLLFRFYDPQKGHISIGGQDIASVSQQSLRQAIGIVPQDTVLFNHTIGYNIRYSKIDASTEEVIAAAKKAEIHAFIESLPEGYDTVVGERGLKLSGGEKQRIAIARAILKSPAILVFDEATSSLDSHAEQKILHALRALSEQHTTLVIAHRLSTIVDADTIVVLDKGHVAESGTHQQLLQQAGLYASLWQKQQNQPAQQD